MAADLNELLAKVQPSRREFVRKAIVGGAFAAPIVSSFSLDGLNLGGNPAFAVTNGSDPNIPS